jgi:translocation and assembly module TamA
MLFSPRTIALCLFTIVFQYTSASYAIEVDLEGPEDNALGDNIKAHLAIVEAPTSCEISSSFNELVTTSIHKASQALGYYHATVEHMLLSGKSCDELQLTIQQGPQTKIINRDMSLIVDGPTDNELQQAIDTFPLAIGDPLHHNLYSSAKAALLSLSQLRGYFDATFDKQQIQVDTRTNTAQITLAFNIGKRYQFGELKLPPHSRTETLVNQVLTFAQGDYYHAEKLATFNQNLKLLGYFQQVVARPILDKASNHLIPIEVIATNKPRDIFNLGGGVSTDTGPRVQFKWERPWVNLKGHSFSTEIFASALEQNLRASYRIPLQNPLDNYLSFQVGFRAEDNNDTESETFTASAQRHWGEGRGSWSKIGFLRLDQESFTQGNADRESTTLFTPGFTLSRRRSRGGLDVNWGDRQRVTVEGTSRSIISDIDIFRVSAESKWIRSIKDHRFTLRAELGAIATNDFSQVPPSLRYFAGGDQSIRGFGFENLSPIVEGELTGGRFLTVASVEYSYPIVPNWRLATFVDAGNASDDPFEDTAYSYGLGGSWLSPVGPIRLYLARGNSETESTFRLHFSMGPSL